MKRNLKIFILVLCLFSGNGCWDRKELKSQSIVAAMGVDRSAGGAGKYLYTFQLVKPAEAAGGGGKKAMDGGGVEARVLVGTSEGRTPYEAGRNIAFQLSRRVFFAHNQALIIGKEAAKKGVGPILDLDLRFYQIRTTEFFLIAKGTAKEILEVQEGLEDIPAFNISGMLKGYRYTSEAFPVSLKDFLQYLAVKSRAPVAPQIEVFGEGAEKKLRLSGTAVFKGDRWIGELDGIETRGMLWVLGQVKRGTVNIPSRSGTEAAVCEVLESGSKVRPELRHGKIAIKISVRAQGNLENVLIPVNLSTPEKLHELEERMAAVIRGEILAAWKKARRLKADVFGFGAAVYRRYPREWKSLEPEWDRLFPQITLQIKVDTLIGGVGEVNSPPLAAPPK